MTDDIIKTSDDGRYRVRLVQDTDPVNPRRDYDHISHVITPAQSGHFIDIDENGGPLQYGWDYFSARPDGEKLFIRWARMVHGAVVVTHAPAGGAWGLWYLMPDGIAEVTDPVEYLRAEIAEYQSWAEGDVWGWIIEESVTWQRTDGKGEPVTVWEEIPEDGSCWGYIGHTYAVKAAEEAFAEHLKTTTT